MDYVEVVALQRAISELQGLIDQINKESAKYEVAGRDYNDRTYAQGMRYARQIVTNRLDLLKQEDIREGNDNGSE